MRLISYVETLLIKTLKADTSRTIREISIALNNGYYDLDKISSALKTYLLISSSPIPASMTSFIGSSE